MQAENNNKQLRTDLRTDQDAPSTEDAEQALTSSPELDTLLEELERIKQENEALRQASKLYQTYIENADDIILTVSPEGVMLSISPNWTNYLHQDLEIILNHSVFETILHPADVPDVKESLHTLIETRQKVKGLEYRVLQKDGSIKWFSSNASPNFNEQGEIESVLVLARDVTQKKNIAIALEESRARMREAQRIGKIGDWEWRADEDFVRWSDEMYRIFNVSPGTVITRKKADEIFPPGERERVLGLTQIAIETGLPQPVEAQVLRDNGEIGYIYGKGQAIFDENGNLSSIIGFYQDITEQRLYEEQLKKSEAKYRLLLETMKEGAVFVDNDDVIQYINQSCCDFFGYNPQDLIGKKGYQYLIHEDDRQIILDKNLDRLRGESDVYEVRGRKVSGEIIWLKVSGAPLHDENGEVLGSMGVMTDITEQKKAENVKFRLLNILDSSINEIYMFNEDTLRFTYVNQGVLLNTGYTHSEIMEMTPLDLKPEFTETNFRAKMDQLTSGNKDIIVFATNHRRKDGSLYPVEVHLQYHKQEDGDLFLAIVNDVTESKSLKEQLFASQKMDAIGRLAGGIAHDFNNLLTVILGYGEELMHALALDDPARLEAEEIVKAGQRASSLTHQLLAFSRKQLIQPKILDMNKLLANLEGMLTRLIGEHIDIVTEYADDVAMIKADPGQIEQVIVNLAVNARDAMPGGGKLSVVTANHTIDSDNSDVYPDAETGKYLLLSITDNGCGMDKETVDRIFEPFFSTKEMGKGLGLGLSTVYGIVKQAGGFITVDSEPGKGTCFKVFLPATEEKQVSRMAASLGNEHIGNGESILIVEDEELLLKLFAKLIGNLGYQVTINASSEQALQLLQNGFKPDLIITDVIMPGMNGKVLIDKVWELYPQQKVLFMSGFTDDVLAQQGVLNQGIPFIQKPFTARGMAIKIKQLLG